MLDSKNSDLVSFSMDKGVFSSDDQQRVESTVPDTDYNRNEVILNLIARKSQKSFFNFISALNETNQTHVAVALIGLNIVAKVRTLYDGGHHNGNMVLPNVDTELLAYMREMFARDDSVVKQLKRILSANGLAVSSVREGCIQVTFRCKTYESLLKLQELYNSGELQNLLNEAFCPRFVDNGLISSELEISDETFAQCANMFSRWAPMTPEHHKALLSSAKWLRDNMIVDDDLLDKLSLCRRCRQTIQVATTREERVKTLLDVISRQPDSAFEQFLEALKTTKQFVAISNIRSRLPPEDVRVISQSTNHESNVDEVTAGSKGQLESIVFSKRHYVTK